LLQARAQRLHTTTAPRGYGVDKTAALRVVIDRSSRGGREPRPARGARHFIAFRVRTGGIPVIALNTRVMWL
jgi:hypothetical protein